MQKYSEAEFLSDMQVAVTSGSSEVRRKEAIEWHIGRSAHHEQKILKWLLQLEVLVHVDRPRCQPLVRAVYDSTASSLEDLMDFYIKSHNSYKSVLVREQVRDVLFSSKSLFLGRFNKLDDNIKQGLLAELFTVDPYQSRFSLEICCLSECCNWRALERLVPSRETWFGESDIQSVARNWFRVWETYQDFYRINEKGAS